jgi:pyruvate formate lyase activating enzyme
MEVDEVLDEVLKDEAFYIQSGGGMTLSGGEPLEQSDFSAALLSACKEKAVHTAVETAGNVCWEDIERVMPHTDLFLFDVKHIDPEVLLVRTRADASLILSNLKNLAGAGGKIIVRIPVIPGFNDTPDVIDKICRFARDLGLSEVHLLPYHRYGQGKYRLLGRSLPFNGPGNVTGEGMNLLRDAAAKEGLRVRIGG